MNIAQLNLVAVVGRQGFIGCEGEQPRFPDQATATAFSVRVVQLCTGGTAIIGGRSYQRLRENGWDRSKAPFDTFVWDRDAQGMMDPEDAVAALAEAGSPIFVLGGRYTYECFMPWVEQMFITRAALTIGPNPLYMPELFGRTQ